MVLSEYNKQRILHHYSKGHKVPTIVKLLQEEQLKASRVGVAKFIKHFEDTGMIARRPGPVLFNTDEVVVDEPSLCRCSTLTTLHIHRASVVRL